MSALCARFLCFLCYSFCSRHEKVKIVEEPAVYRSGMNHAYQPGVRQSSQNENKLVTRVKPSPVSVYPVLSPDGQKQWEQIEEALYREELTIQGYNKYRRALFQKENLIPRDRTEKEKQKDEKEVTGAVEEALSSHAGDSSVVEKSSTFRSTEECFKAYNDILAEVQRLRKLLNMSCFGCNDSTNANTNGSVQSNSSWQGSDSDAGERTHVTTRLKSNATDRFVVHGLKTSDAERALKGEIGDRRKAQKKPLETGDNNKAYLSIVENLRGDPGVKRNETVNSNDSKQRKSDMLVHAKRAATQKQTVVKKKSLENKLRGKAGEF
ncbi:hypothetical protein OS493_018032 [Desmophyllum pertusum]|uniref:DMAP1-binding domain-containing protein n=1 Tax=Desmophyllum pertusum TaxID=174260 RepID=A0A9W9Z1R0_9CNID|nr:hypothetical protein OS493_018032 [Desmophyllum pertusum]